MEQDDNYNRLLQAVSKKAALDRETILAEAKAQVKEIEAQTRDELDQIQGQIRAEADRAILLEKDRLLGQSQMASRLVRQSARVRLLERAFAEAHKAMAALPKSPAYSDILGGLIAETLAFVGPDATIKVAASEETLCREWINKHKLTCQLDGINAEPGTVVALAKEGDREMDNSLATRLARVESLYQQDVAVTLFQEETKDRGHE